MLYQLAAVFLACCHHFREHAFQIALVCFLGSGKVPLDTVIIDLDQIVQAVNNLLIVC
ncbi:hypothetical protein D3C86_2057730 [compost metagenome]